MIDKVEAAAGCLPFLPPRRHGAKVDPGHALPRDVPGYPRIVPGGDPAAKVVEVDLALLGCPHLISFRQIIRLVQNCPRQKPDPSNYSQSHNNLIDLILIPIFVSIVIIIIFSQTFAWWHLQHRQE